MNNQKKKKYLFECVETKFIELFICAVLCYQVVSYTHLDVYKRQELIKKIKAININ